MAMSKETREIRQLWYASKLYYSLLPDDIDSAEMGKTIGDWSVECESLNDFYNTPLFTFACHLDSCAIRLYSKVGHYEEKGKDQEHKRSYQEIESYYHSLTFQEIFIGLKDVINSIAMDLRQGAKGEKIEVDSFV